MPSAGRAMRWASRVRRWRSHASGSSRAARSTNRSSTDSRTSISACARASRGARSSTSPRRDSRTTKPHRRAGSTARPRTSGASSRAGRARWQVLAAHRARRASARSSYALRATKIRCSQRRAPISKARFAVVRTSDRAAARVAPWQRLDRRFREAATLAWFAGEPRIAGRRDRSQRRAGDADSNARRGRSRGAVAALRGGGSRRRARRPALGRRVVLGRRNCRRRRRPLRRARSSRSAIVRSNSTPRSYSAATGVELACVVHAGRTDDASFGNVLLAQAGVPAVVLAKGDVRALFASDVALFCEVGRWPIRSRASQATRRCVAATERSVAADSRRRFSPRRSAIRVVDLLCAARFGLERPGAARSNSPL